MSSAIARALSSLVSATSLIRRGALADAMFFDESSYREQNQDVATSVESGLVRSFYDHYVRYGKWEGRRFALRRFGLDEEVAQRAFAAVASLEARLDVLACTLSPGEVAHRLRSSAGQRLEKPLGPWKRELDGGPWRAPVDCTLRRGGSFMIRARVAPVRAPLAIRILDGGGEVLAAAGMFCRPTRAALRMIRVPPGAREIEIALLDGRVRAQPLRVRLLRVPEIRVEGRLLRRLMHHDPSCIGESEVLVRARFAREASASGQSTRDRMWTAYERTFPPPRARSTHAEWIQRAERPFLERLDHESGARIEALRDPPRVSVLVPVLRLASSPERRGPSARPSEKRSGPRLTPRSLFIAARALHHPDVANATATKHRSDPEQGCSGGLPGRTQPWLLRPAPASQCVPGPHGLERGRVWSACDAGHQHACPVDDIFQ